MSAPQRLSELLRGIAVEGPRDEGRGPDRSSRPGAWSPADAGRASTQDTRNFSAVSPQPSALETQADLDQILVHGLSLDSRRIRPGDAFVALRGANAHGITFAPAALALGASVVLAEAPAPSADAAGRSEALAPGPTLRPRPSALAPAPALIPIIWIENLRAHVGEIAARFFGRPSESMRVIGVTGTNGKTSIVQLLAAALQSLGARAATIGTLGAGRVGALDEGERTTPDAISVHALLARFHDEGVSDVAMEVSSHALDQGRVDAVAFRLAVFTNLTRDHLDYHGDMAAYGAAKAKLFAWPTLQDAIVNVDDAFGREIAATLPARVRRLRYGIDSGVAEVRARDVRSGAEGLRFVLVTPWGEGEVVTPLLGRFNVANLLAVAASLGALGYGFAQIAGALAGLRPVAGRMNRIGGEHALPLAVVDYAHTPDALEQALSSLRVHCAGRLICVFGCGGERDTGKRPQMGAIAERLADRIIITDDNPRNEDGDAVVRQIVAGLAHPERATVQRDRAQAIALALGEARAGDVVLIAGKGHEPYQEIGGVRRPFDDLAVARRALEARPC